MMYREQAHYIWGGVTHQPTMGSVPSGPSRLTNTGSSRAQATSGLRCQRVNSGGSSRRDWFDRPHGPCTSPCDHQTRRRGGSAQQATQPSPRESVPGVLLAAWRHMLMADQIRHAVASLQGAHEPSQSAVLAGIESLAFQPFELDTNGVVVAVRPPLPLRSTRMPGSTIAGDKLNQLTVSSDQEVRRDLDSPQLIEIRMGVAVELVREESKNLVPAIRAGRQADRMDHDQIHLLSTRARPVVGRGAAHGPAPPPGLPAQPLRRSRHARCCRQTHPHPPPDVPCGSASGAETNQGWRRRPCD